MRNLQVEQYQTPTRLAQDHNSDMRRNGSGDAPGKTADSSLKVEMLRSRHSGHNRLAEKAGWDREILAIELQALIDLDFEVELTGFETAEVDLCLEEAREATGESCGPEDEIPAYTE